ncbi:FAD-dependent monooxygenase [Saccharopolyspora erythraea]|uniref:FAD-dependent monooxygenase n=1 Tax=Saccharopolyspora erythraea TaxID=1836 RepID=UPI001BA7CE5F|nr:FAD-dependent monooxygenase [Saccharopolyspora erythraea]QUH04614.1 FAD-dependent monooxygenase [Saccharopolyspora erythraea]
MDNTDVLISGASVAGPALAHWLRAHGFNPTVVERAPAPREGGYGVDVRGAAVDVVERMGVLAQVRGSGIDMRGITYVDGSNRPLAEISTEQFDGRGNGRDLEIMRGALSRILHDATADGVEYVFGDSVTGLEPDDDGVLVTFEHTAPRRFHLVIGADGLHSQVRALAFGAESRFRRHLGHHISIFSVGGHLAADRWTLLHNVPGKLAGVHASDGELGATAILGFASGEIPFDHRDTGQQKRILREAFTGVGWEVPRLLEEMEHAPDFYFDSVSQIHLDRWSRGRVALVGDAGYCPSPLSGQGTSLALVGAYVLAGELRAAGGDHRTAFARYEDRMREYVRQNQKIAESGAEVLMPASRTRIWLRNQVMRFMSRFPALGRLSGGIQRAANAIELPDYGAGRP